MTNPNNLAYCYAEGYKAGRTINKTLMGAPKSKSSNRNDIFTKEELNCQIWNCPRIFMEGTNHKAYVLLNPNATVREKLLQRLYTVTKWRGDDICNPQFHMGIYLYGTYIRPFLECAYTHVYPKGMSIRKELPLNAEEVDIIVSLLKTYIDSARDHMPKSLLIPFENAVKAYLREALG